MPRSVYEYKFPSANEVDDSLKKHAVSLYAVSTIRLVLQYEFLPGIRELHKIKPPFRGNSETEAYDYLMIAYTYP